jgi:hypothetical protein
VRDEPPAPEAWARELRLAQAADARSRRAHWDQLGAEEATTGSTIEALARAGHGVALHLGPAGTHRGRVAELGPDHVRLVAPDRWRYLRLSSVEVVEALDGDAGAHDGPPPERVDRSFVEVVSRLVDEPVTLVLASGAQRVGRVTAVGIEVVTLSGADPSTGLPARPAYVSSSVVVAVLGDGSG